MNKINNSFNSSHKFTRYKRYSKYSNSESTKYEIFLNLSFSFIYGVVKFMCFILVVYFLIKIIVFFL